MKQQVKAVIIASALLAALVIALAVILLTAPKQPDDAGVFDSSDLASDLLSQLGFGDEDGGVIITNLPADTLQEVRVQNAGGSFSITRKTRDETDYWTTDALLEVAPDEAKIGYFVSTLAVLSGESLVEESPEDPGKYGLLNPAATVEFIFEDGTVKTLSFGMRHPAREDYVYCMIDGRVYLTEYAAVSEVFSDQRAFAKLSLTEAYDPEETGEAEYVKIERSDLEQPVEIRYMSELADVPEDIVITTFNTHRFVTPVTLEVDASSGGKLYSGVFGLTASSCEFLEQSGENMSRCGLDSPSAAVTFSVGGKERTLLFGNSTGEGYYAVLSGAAGIFLISEKNAPWLTFDVFSAASKNPLSPYIYACESVELSIPDGEFTFNINGENEFSVNGKRIPSGDFKEFYEKLVSCAGEELYTEQTEGPPYIAVKFNYKSEYAEIYGVESDTLSYLAYDGRKYTLNLNGKSIFKVSGIYVSDLLQSAKALLENNAE